MESTTIDRNYIPRMPLKPFFQSKDGAFTLYGGDCLQLLPAMEDGSASMIFADPPYFLSNDGITCKGGRMVRVNKGEWDRSRGFELNYEYTREWLSACRRVLCRDGTVWVSGTSHVIHIVACAMMELGYKILNEITWVKPNPPPNLSCRYFTHSSETILWAAREAASKHTFNYALMKEENGGRQMTSVWNFPPPSKTEKKLGRHPTQKPLALLERIVLASTRGGDLVVDPFCGSGSTGIATVKNGRRFIGIETEQEYLELSARRCLELSRKGSLPE